MPSIRLAAPEDAPDVAVIYAPVVRDTAISFEIDPPDADEMARRITATLPAHPWLVAEDADRVLGYAYAGPHRARAAYRWSVEPSVYVRADARGGGVGRMLYETLFAILRAQGFARAYAGITLPNPASLGIHRSFGFEEIGVYRRVGYKHDRWHDVWWGMLDLVPDRNERPSPLRSVDALAATGALSTLLAGDRVEP